MRTEMNNFGIISNKRQSELLMQLGKSLMYNIIRNIRNSSSSSWLCTQGRVSYGLVLRVSRVVDGWLLVGSEVLDTSMVSDQGSTKVGYSILYVFVVMST